MRKKRFYQTYVWVSLSSTHSPTSRTLFFSMTTNTNGSSGDSKSANANQLVAETKSTPPPPSVALTPAAALPANYWPPIEDFKACFPVQRDFIFRKEKDGHEERFDVELFFDKPAKLFRLLIAMPTKFEDRMTTLLTTPHRCQASWAFAKVVEMIPKTGDNWDEYRKVCTESSHVAKACTESSHVVDKLADKLLKTCVITDGQK